MTHYLLLNIQERGPADPRGVTEEEPQGGT